MSPSAPEKRSSPFLEHMGIELDSGTRARVFMDGYMMGGLVAIITGAMVVADALSSAGNKQFETAVRISTIIASVGSGLTSMFAAPCALQSKAAAEIASACTGVALVYKFHFAVTTYPNPEQGKKIAAGVDSIFAAIALATTLYHFSELAHQPATKDRKEAYLVESANICNYLRRFANFWVQMSKDPDVAVAMGVLIAAWGSLQMAAAAEEPKDD
jgi:hypothetical protein